jgi:hypothetical protein
MPLHSIDLSYSVAGICNFAIGGLEKALKVDTSFGMSNDFGILLRGFGAP